MTALSRRVFGLVAAMGLTLLAACNVNLEDIEAPGLPKDKDAAAREVYQHFRTGDLGPIRARFAPEMQGPQAEAAFPQITALIPKTEPTKSRLASWNIQWDSLTGARTENLVTKHEYTYPDLVVEAETVLARSHPAQGQPGPWMIRGFHIQRKPVGAAAAPAAPATTGAQPAAATDSNEFVTPEQAAAEAASAPSEDAAPDDGRANNRQR